MSARAALLQALISGDGYGLELIERVREKSKGAVVLHQWLDLSGATGARGRGVRAQL